MPPPGFSWINQPRLAALACPQSSDDLRWLRRHGVDVLISLTEDPLPRQWLNDAGMLAVSVPVEDMSPPSERQLEHIVATIHKANKSGMGVAIHCTAGLGRTGTVLAAYFVTEGLSARDAIVKVRDLRPGSVETVEQEIAVDRYASRRSSDKSAPEDKGFD